MGETAKAYSRRFVESFYQLYCQGKGIDIGCGNDPIPVDGVKLWDKDEGDATLMEGVPDATYDYVYCSHVLEHIQEPQMALFNWYRVLKPGGFLLLAVPHRDLYERRKEPPSRWNLDHKTFWLPWHSEPPATRGLLPELLLLGGQILSIRVCMEGFSVPPDDSHSLGEFSIEAIVRKPLPPD